MLDDDLAELFHSALPPPPAGLETVIGELIVLRVRARRTVRTWQTIVLVGALTGSIASGAYAARSAGRNALLDPPNRLVPADLLAAS